MSGKRNRPCKKRGPKPRSSDAEIAAAIVKGLNDSDIARALHCDRKRVARIRAQTNSLITAPTPQVELIKEVARRELTQEGTLNEMFEQMADYTKNYRDAMAMGDHKAAGGWAMLRLRLLEQMIRLSGLEERARSPPSAGSGQITVRWLSAKQADNAENKAITLSGFVDSRRENVTE